MIRSQSHVCSRSCCREDGLQVTSPKSTPVRKSVWGPLARERKARVAKFGRLAQPHNLSIWRQSDGRMARWAPRAFRLSPVRFVWLHLRTVGFQKVLVAVLDHMAPNTSVLLSVTTPTSRVDVYAAPKRRCCIRSICLFAYPNRT